ncbi:PPOX class F420-dependent oxidoreductase [Streptomyces globisporus]|uniref:PPOX class F420-dependent oxidoreductase n=1 Tax=Streptomyces globisporus TaxID=1908 RepID=UPI0036C56D5C
MSPTRALPDRLVSTLGRANPAVMSTLRQDGAPVSVATWYLWEEGRVLVNLDAGRKRLAHLRADPRVSLTVLDADSWYRHISLQGRVVTLEDDGGLRDIDRIAQHYIGERYPDRQRPRVSAWIEIETWHAWGMDDTP